MIQISVFKTVTKSATAEIVEKKSRFIARVERVVDEESAVAFLSDIRTRHWDARHNVYAYRLQKGASRSSDDGEPSGTAGRPLLDLLTKEDLYNTLIVVTRYFGGTLLGCGGLVRAYTSAAKAALQEAGLSEIRLLPAFRVTASYEFLPIIKNAAKVGGFIIKDIEYGKDVILTIAHHDPDELTEKISTVTSGSALFVQLPNPIEIENIIENS